MSNDPASLAAELWAALGSGEQGGGLSPALLAAYLDGGLDGEQRAEVQLRLAASPEEFHNAIASVAYLESLVIESAPRDLVDAAPAHSPDNVTPLPPRGSLPVEQFLLLAAASETGSKAVLCRSQSGIWTLEIFVAPEDKEKGYLLLSVHPDHRDTYEGRTARIFTQIGNDERVLAEESVRAGEIYTPILLSGLDLHTRDAINVTFGPSPP